MGARTVSGRVRYEVRRARRFYRCDMFPCPVRIEAGRQYLLLVALPGHEVAPPFDELRACVQCVEKRALPLFEHFTDYP